jgi:hypothetical protein
MPALARSPLTQHDVESLLLDLSDRLADATDEFRDLCDATSQAEMDYKHAFHSSVVALASGTKVTADVRKSTAWLRSENAERAYVTLTAAKEAAREHLRTLTTRIEALRTVSANVRNQT